MQASNIPTKFPIPFGNAAADIRPIPTASQTPSSSDAPASLTDGFPHITAQPTTAGGIPPNIQDFNGILNQLSAWSRWQAAGGASPYDSAFATAIGGYPLNARISSVNVPGKVFVNLTDGNTTNPEGSSPSGWIATGVGGTATNAKYEFLPNGDLHQYGAVGYNASNTPTQQVTITLPLPFSAGLRIIASTSQGANSAWAAMSCVASLVGLTQASFFLHSCNASQNITLSGQICWDAIGTA